MRLNDSRSDIINNKQSTIKNIDYVLSDMYASMNCGNYRTNQEDSILLLEHPINHDFKMLALADGMGGLMFGSKASNIALFELLNWFESLPEDFFFQISKALLSLDEKVNKIDQIIRLNCCNGGTTLAMAITFYNKTFTLNIGDSRIYIDCGNDFKQISIDHSLTWNMYLDGKILSKDNMRFHKMNNLITSRLGGEKKMLNIKKNILDPISYNSLFLFSDGITDCLSDFQIYSIIKNNSSLNILKELVSCALNTVSVNNSLDSKDYYNTIYGGKDNETVAMLIRKKC